MTTRKSYNQLHAEFVQRERRKNPELAALWGVEDVSMGCQPRRSGEGTVNPIRTGPGDSRVSPDSSCSYLSALEQAAIAAFGRAPTSEHERYSAAECLDAAPCLKGRGED